MLNDPSAGSPSNSSRYWPDSACQRLPPSLTTTRSATAQMLKPGQRHGVGQMAAQLLHRARDPPARHVGRGERLGGAQHDQILEREQPGIARPARGRDESGVDQRADRAARQAQQLLDVAHAVLVHGGRTGCRAGRLAYRLAAFFAAGSACCARLGGLRVSARGSRAFAGAFFSRLARSASMRSMTCAPRLRAPRPS